MLGGFYLGAILFRAGRDDLGAVLPLAFAINFALFGGTSYWLLTRIWRGTAGAGRAPKNCKPAPDPTSARLSQLPRKGIIYTESEIEEFKRKGLM